MSSTSIWSRCLYNPWYAVSAILGVGLLGSYATFGAFRVVGDRRLQQLAACQAASESALLRSRLDLLIANLEPLSTELGRQRLVAPAAIQPLAAGLLRKDSTVTALQWVPLVFPAESSLFDQQLGRFGAGTAPKLRFDAERNGGDQPYWLVCYTEPRAYAEAGRTESEKTELVRSLEKVRHGENLSLAAAQPGTAANGAGTTVQVIKPVAARFATDNEGFKNGEFTGALVAVVRIEALVNGIRPLSPGNATDLLLVDITADVPEGSRLLYSSVLDYDELAATAAREKPKMITVGASAYSRIIDFARLGEIARANGAMLFADIAHIAGLVAAGLHPSPVPHADFVTTTTHKTLRGPRGGLILCKAQHAKALDSAMFPGAQGGPLMHVIAAKAVCFGENLKPEFKAYSEQILKNSKALCAAMSSRGYKIVSGGTDNHLFLVDLRSNLPELTAKKAQETLDLANITCNKNTVPFETRSPFQASGIRLGTPAVTSRGMVEKDMEEIASCIDLVLKAIGTEGEAAAIAESKQRVIKLTARFPLPYHV